jgi:hypothetical protein
MRCEDCGATVVGEDVELGAIVAGITICEECIAQMEAEAEAYERMRIEAGEPACDWFERQIAYAEGRLVKVEPAAPLPSAGGER